MRREYLSVHFCGHFLSIDRLSNRTKIDNADHVKYYKNALPNSHKILRETTVLKTGNSVDCGSDELFWRLALESFKIGIILVGNTEKRFEE